MVAPFRLTPQQLLEYLAATGRIVAPRALADWRAKGLLPKLQGKGRGRGPGRPQYWDDPAVIGQAIILHDTMARKRRADYARWVLWFCGYNVDPVLVRKYWLKILKKQQLDRDLEPGEFPADKYTAEIDRLAKNLAKAEYLNSQMAPPIAREIIIAANELPEISVVEDEFEELFAAAQCWISRLNREKNIKLSINRKSFHELVRLFRTVASYGALRRTLEKSAVDELDRAQSYLCTIGSLLRALVIAGQKSEIDEIQLLQIRRLSAPIFGKLIFEAILLIRNSGQEQILRSAQRVMTGMKSKLALEPSAPGEPNSCQAEFDKLLSIFSDLDWHKLYKSS